MTTTSLFLLLLAAHVVGLWVALQLVKPVAAPPTPAYPRVPREFATGEWKRVGQ